MNDVARSLNADSASVNGHHLLVAEKQLIILADTKYSFMLLTDLSLTSNINTTKSVSTSDLWVPPHLLGPR